MFEKSSISRLWAVQLRDWTDYADRDGFKSASELAPELCKGLLADSVRIARNITVEGMTYGVGDMVILSGQLLSGAPRLELS